jgi:autotransporter-associated beta strand protein
VVFQFPDADGLLSGIIAGRGDVVKQGAGTLTIAPTSINTYTGATRLLGGTLRVDGAIGAAGAAAAFTLAPGTTLTGGGDINAPVFSSSTSARIVSRGSLALGDGLTDGFEFAGTLLVSAGDNVTLRDADLAQLGILTSIAVGGRLTALSGVEVGSGERLAGFGAVSGNIVVLSGGSVTPGASPGTVHTAKGDLMLLANSTYLAEVSGIRPGSQHDQISVQGTVNLNGAVLSLSGGAFRPPTGTIFTLIANDDGGGVPDRVQGHFFGLPEGAAVRFGGIEATISYVGGTGNDVTLTVTDLKIIRSLTPDAAVLARNDTGGGGAVFTQRPAAAPLILGETSRQVIIAQGTDSRPQALETRSVERLRVFLKVVDEVTGQEEGESIPLDPRIIDDVQGFFQRYRFPNGRYRIYLQEVGRSPRLIIEISIRDGRAVSPETLPAPNRQAPKNELPRDAEQQEAAFRPAAAPMAKPTAEQPGPGEAAAALQSSREPMHELLADSQRLPRTRFHRCLADNALEHSLPN